MCTGTLSHASLGDSYNYCFPGFYHMFCLYLYDRRTFLELVHISRFCIAVGVHADTTACFDPAALWPCAQDYDETN